VMEAFAVPVTPAFAELAFAELDVAQSVDQVS